MLLGKIKNFLYRKHWNKELNLYSLDKNNINELPSCCHISVNKKVFALSKWVSPKRTRSYPYACVYDTFDSCSGKIVTIIPIIKDEGISGDIDYLQWDTISLMSLLNVYVIIGFYDKAEINSGNNNTNKTNKITKQKFNHHLISNKLHNLISYHQSALHWNLNELSEDNLSSLIQSAKQAYFKISRTLNVLLHKSTGIDNFVQKISADRDSFMRYSRKKAQLAQNREFLTLQPKEFTGYGRKTKIIIENYLGGYYYFTIDDVIERDGIPYLIENKHSKSSILPSYEDIKDGLLKLMLYNNLSTLVNDKGDRKFSVVLRLTSPHLLDNIEIPNTTEHIEKFTTINRLNAKQSEAINKLNEECMANHFYIWIHKVRN